MTNDKQIEAVARAIAKYIYESQGLETMCYSGIEDYANREWHKYVDEAKASIEASYAQYVPQLVEALREVWPRYQELFVLSGLGEAKDSVIAEQVEKALANLPEELRG